MYDTTFRYNTVSTLKCCKCLFDGYSTYLSIVFSKFFTEDYCLLFYSASKANPSLPLFLRSHHLPLLTQSHDCQIPHVDTISALSHPMHSPCARGLARLRHTIYQYIYNYTDIIIKFPPSPGMPPFSLCLAGYRLRIPPFASVPLKCRVSV